MLIDEPVQLTDGEQIITEDQQVKLQYPLPVAEWIACLRAVREVTGSNPVPASYRCYFPSM